MSRAARLGAAGATGAFNNVPANNSASETTAVVRELHLPLVTRGR